MTETIDPKPIKASIFSVPALLANHAQVLTMENTMILEFRLLLPETSPEGVTPGVHTYKIEADLNMIPPVARIVINSELANQLAELIKTNLELKANHEQAATQ